MNRTISHHSVHAEYLIVPYATFLSALINNRPLASSVHFIQKRPHLLNLGCICFSVSHNPMAAPAIRWRTSSWLSLITIGGRLEKIPLTDSWLPDRRLISSSPLASLRQFGAGQVTIFLYSPSSCSPQATRVN